MENEDLNKWFIYLVYNLFFWDRIGNMWKFILFSRQLTRSNKNFVYFFCIQLYCLSNWYLIKYYVHLLKWFEQKEFRCWSPLYNEKQSTHGVVYHLSFTSSLFSRCSSRIFFLLITYHMNYQIDVDSHDRSIDRTHSFLLVQLDIHGNKHMGNRYFVCIVHANTLITFLYTDTKEWYTNILNVFSFSKACLTRRTCCSMKDQWLIDNKECPKWNILEYINENFR